jgi:tripartite motif-containing protein 71
VVRGSGMWAGGRLLVVGLLCCVVGLLGWFIWPSGSVSTHGSGSAGGSQSGDVGLLESSLVVPGVQAVDGDQQVVDAEWARRASAGAFLARERSRTEFTHLGVARAMQVVREAFPTLVEQRSGGAPVLPAGERIVRYLSPRIAQLELPGGKRAVVESFGPMAKRTASGRLTSINLALRDVGGSYVPVASDIAVRIPKRLGEGVRTPEDGVSLTPVDAAGNPLAGIEGTVDGASVLYANTQADSDTVAKPTSRGVELGAVLRSIESPHQFYYRVGMPNGASLVQGQEQGLVQVVSNGGEIATIMPPSAVDASGTQVPVTMSIKGDSLILEVGDYSGEYQYPIEVDPELASTEDRSLTGAVFPIEPYKGGTAWVPTKTSSAFHYEELYSCGTETYWCNQTWNIEPTASYNGGEFAGIQYETQGESKAYKLEAWVVGDDDPSETHSQLEFDNHEGSQTNKSVLSEGPYYKDEPATICALPSSCASAEAPAGNIAKIMNYTTKHEGIYGFSQSIWSARVYIAQEKGPEASFNTSSPTISKAENRSNVLYGSGSWLGPNSGAFEGAAKDPGIGVSFAAFAGAGMSEERFIRDEEGKCLGVQCSPTYSGQVTYLPSMDEGEDSIEFFAEDAAGLDGYTYETVKVDAAKPYNLEVSGWPKSREISAAPHTLTVGATDGVAPKPSSGVKSIKVAVDGGQESTVSGAACPRGECKAKGEWTLHAENLTEGVHRLVVTATDNAGNVASKEWTFDVHHANPVSAGPGTIDPTTGQFQLTATDVSLGGVSGVSRVYQSRNLTGGIEGPFGPQWAIGLGGSENLTVLPEGSAVLTAASGGRTTFTRNSKGEFESPLGDENLKVEAEEPVKGKGITEYLVIDTRVGSTIRFTQPIGTESTTPVYANQFGAEGVGLDRPTGVAIDPSGNVWVADYMNGRIVKFSPSGTLLGTYGYYGSGEGGFLEPREIAINQSNGDVYVTDEGNNRVVELNEKGEFVETFGWGVKDGKEEFEICKGGSSCRAGISGSGSGQFHEPKGVALDSSGDVWIADYGNNRIEEFNASGEYQQKFGKEGSGEAQFKDPAGIAFSGGSIYVSEYGNNRVQKLSTAGKYEGQFGKGGSGNGEFNEPRGIAADPKTGNLYVADTGNNRVQEFSSSGALIAKFGSAGSGSGQFSEPKGIAVNASGGVYITDYNNSRVQEWMRASWLPTLAEGSVKSSSTAAYIYGPVEVEEGKTVIEPSEVLAPTPAGVSCGTKPEELKKGCRALLFAYATKTSATGEGRSEWGEYKGRLAKVSFKAYNPALGSEKLETKAVAEYSYDKQGRLRAEWDPRISPGLVTTYGYDAEGHVTALTSPGREPWAFTYGTIPGDSNTGRLVKMTQAQPKVGTSEEAIKERLHEQEQATKNTEAPKLSGSPVVGVTMGVSSGAWSNSPVAYSYQWEDCNSTGEECVLIPGATNANYTVMTSDDGHTLVAVVKATNGGGSVSDPSAPSTIVSGTTKESAAEYSLKEKGPYDITMGPDGNLWFTDPYSGTAPYTGTVEKITPSGTITEYTAFTGSHPENITDGPGGDLWFTEDVYSGYSFGRIVKMTTSGTVAAEYILPNESWPRGITTGPDGNLWYTDFVRNKIGKMTASGTIAAEYALPKESNPYGITRGPEGDLWYTDYGTNKIGKITTSGTITEYALPSGSWPVDITDGPEGDLWYTDKGTNKIGKITTSGAITEYALPSGSRPEGITEGPDGNAWYTDHETGKVGKITASGSIIEYALPKGSSPANIAADPEGGLWYTDEGTSKIGEIPTWGTTTPSEGTHYTAGPGTTIEYHVPVSGVGLPTLTKEEVEKWGQRDKNEKEDNDPTEGTAIFPPDEPQGWPASDYKRATIDYLNEKGLTVNTASPTGGISTIEYNEANEATRTLSADDRAAALKEGCVSISKKECKSAEVSELLDTKTKYNLEDSEILETIGPEHKIKLSTGTEVQARNITHDYYNEGAREVEEKTHETYNLATKSTDGALLSNGEEKDVRTITRSYSGQKDLGWELRKPTATTIDPAGLDLTKATEYNETTGNVIETKAPGGTSENVPPPVFSKSFGSEGSGNGQFKHATGVAVDSGGDVWAVDSGDGRVEKFSSSGSFLGAYGSKGTGVDQFEEPWGIAINQSTGNVYVSDSSNNRIEELNSSGAFVETIGWGVSDGKSELEVCKSSCKAGLAGSGNGQLKEPLGITTDSHGDVFVVDYGNDRVQEFSEEGAYMEKFGTVGSGNGQLKEPVGIAISEGEIYVVDNGNGRVEEFSPGGAYLNQFGSTGSGAGQFKEAVGIAVNPNNSDIYVSDETGERVEEFSPAGKFLVEFGMSGKGPGQFKEPMGLAVNASGDLYVSEENGDRVDEWAPPAAGGAHMTYSTQFGSTGSGSGQFEYPAMTAIDGQGDVWVTDYSNARIEKFTAQGKFLASYGSKGSGEVQFKQPTGIAINQGTGNVYVADCENNRIEELSSSGSYIRAFGSSGSGTGQFNCPGGVKIDASGDVWVADINNDRIQEFSSTGTFIAAYGSKGSGNGQFNEPIDIAISGSDIYVADAANHRVQELTTTGTYVAQFGSEGNGGGQFDHPESISTDAAGHLYVVDTGNERIQEFSATGQFLTSFGSRGTGNGQLTSPQGITINPAGDAYVTDSGDNRVEVWDPNNQATHDTKTIYYTAKTEAEITACQNHPEWAGLPCQIQPAAQPEDGLPELPVTTMTYNLWDEIETTTEKFGSTTRTKTETYDSAGRALTSEEASTKDTALPKVTNEYNSETGTLEKQKTTAGGETKTITSKYNTLGQLAEYIDADGNIAKYVYEEGSDDRLIEINEGKGEEAKSSQTYSYDSTTGLMTKLVDSAAGTFTASYDVEGKMISEIYPNGMCANSTYNSAGTATQIEYIKTRNCSESHPTVWFSDSMIPSIHGETLQQTSTLSKENYGYDTAGRLTETQETPAGKGCVTRLYAYNEESNRTSLTTREPGTEGKCANEGGTVERHTYDNANRLTDENTTYETFGNTTKLPPTDAGGGGGGHELKSTYYVDSQVATQEQNGETINYFYDPSGRARKTVSEGKTSSTVISHYAGPGEALTWTSEGTEKWTRNIPGIDGALDAIQTNGGTPTLQLHDLQGDIVGTAALSETETKLLSTYNSTEFGVPTTSSPPKYSWLGAGGVSSELTSSGISTQGGASYVPQIAKDLQTAPVIPPGAFPNGPIGGTQNTATVSAASFASSEAIAKQIFAEAEAARQKAREEEAEEALLICREEGGCGAAPGGGGGGESPEGEEATGYCEVAAVTGQEAEGCIIQRSLTGQVGSGGDSVAEAAFDHTWSIPGWASLALGSTIALTVGSSELGGFVGILKIPSWFLQALDTKLIPGGRAAFAAALVTAGRGAAPDTDVRIEIWGSLKYTLYWNVEWKELT